MAFNTVEVDSGSYSPESLRLRRRLAEAMLQQGMSSGPVGHWTQGANRILQAMLGGYQLGELERKEKAQQEAGNAALLGLLGPAGASAPMPTETAAPALSTQPSAMPEVSAEVAPFAGAIASIESAHEKDPYKALGPVVKSGDRAYGKYQVMGENVGPWTKEILGQEMTPSQFLNSPEAQEKVFAGKFGQYLRQTGNPQDAASMWFTGTTADKGADRQARDAEGNPLGITGKQYVDRFTAGLNSGQGGSTQGPAPSTARTPAAPAQVELPPQVTPEVRRRIGMLLSNPATRELGMAMLQRFVVPPKPMTPLEQAELANKQASLAKTQAETAKTQAELPKPPEQVAEQFTGGLQQLGRLPGEFGTEAFERAIGPFSATMTGDDSQGGLWGTGASVNSLGQMIARGMGEAKAALFGGAAPTEVRDRIETAMKNLAAVMKPMIRKPGEGAWTDKDQANLEAQIGQLSRARDVGEYRRRLNDIEENMQKIFAVPVRTPEQLPRSANAPKTAEEEQTLPERFWENASDEQILKWFNQNVLGLLRGSGTPEEKQEMMLRAMQAGGY